MTGDFPHARLARFSLVQVSAGATTGSVEVGKNSGSSLSRASETNQPSVMKYASATTSESERPIGQRPE